MRARRRGPMRLPTRLDRRGMRASALPRLVLRARLLYRCRLPLLRWLARRRLRDGCVPARLFGPRDVLSWPVHVRRRLGRSRLRIGSATAEARSTALEPLQSWDAFV